MQQYLHQFKQYITLPAYLAYLIKSANFSKGNHQKETSALTNVKVREKKSPSRTNSGSEILSRHKRVIHGNKVEKAEAPHLVWIRTQAQECTGVAVEPNKVLTAKHCVEKKGGGLIDKNKLTIYADATDKASMKKGYKLDTGYIPNCAINKHLFAPCDYAVLTTKEPLPVSKVNIISQEQYQQLNISMQEARDNKSSKANTFGNLEVQGFGLMRNSRGHLDRSPYAQQTMLTAYESGSEGLLARSITGKGTDSCSGDSGGPLLYSDAVKGGKKVLAGLVSSGPRDCRGTISYNVDVYQAKEQIEKAINFKPTATACAPEDMTQLKDSINECLITKKTTDGGWFKPKVYRYNFENTCSSNVDISIFSQSNRIENQIWKKNLKPSEHDGFFSRTNLNIQTKFEDNCA